MSKWIKSGISVVNITNLDIVWVVSKICFRSKKIDVDGKIKNINRITGVEVKRLEGNETKVTKFHSKELIPLSVASKGKLECYKFVNREGEYKDW